MFGKTHRPARHVLAVLAVLAAATGSVNAQAYSVPIPNADLVDARQGGVVKVAYGATSAGSRAMYAAPKTGTPSSPSVASAPSADFGEVEFWQLLLAVIGLAGIRMWRAGKKSLPLLG